MGDEVRSGFIVIAAALLVASLSLSVFAADPGHAATSIGAGSFESGNYSFPDTLEIIRGLNVSNGLLYVDPTTNNVGIGTTSPAQKLNVGGSANVTGDVFLSTYGLLNCQGKLITDSTGNITCGTDATGSGGMDYTNVAMTNESNAFAAGYNQTFDTNTLFVDATGDKVGIGTDSPSTVLHVNGTFSVENTTGVQGLYQNAEGNVGIGTTSPGVVLDTAGTIRSTSMSTPTSGSGVEVRFSSETGFISAQNRSASTILPLKLYGNNVLINDAAGGNVGIGTTSPSFKLDVYGDTNTTGLLINATNCDSLDTNADGLIICGSDAAGSTGWSNVAFVNESNTFTPNQTFSDNIFVTNNVGIGTTGPGYKLHLYEAGSNDVAVALASWSNEYAKIYWKNRNSVAVSYSDGAVLYTDALVLKSGNVGIGTTNPAAKLEVDGTFNATGASGVTGLYVDSGGSVGIGAAPVTTLYVYDSGIANFRIVSPSQPRVEWTETNAATDEKNWQIYANSGTLDMLAWNDAWSLGNSFLIATRSGTTITGIRFGGNVAVNNNTAGNILTIQQSSPTDPIADSWTTYTSDRQHKDILREVNPQGYLDRIKNEPVYEYKRKVIVSDEEVESSLNESGQGRKYGTSAFDEKKSELVQSKASMPKFNTTRVGIAVDDPETPKEILTFDGSGNIQGIDLLAYSGFLHAAVKESALRMDELDSRITVLEGGSPDLGIPSAPAIAGNPTAVPNNTGVNGTVETVANDSEPVALEENISELNQRVESLESEIALLREELVGMKKAGEPQPQKPETPPQDTPSVPPGEVNVSNATDKAQAAAIPGGNVSEVQNESQRGQGITGMATAVAREGRGLVWRWISGLVGQSGRDG